jgi:hypothetical protein
MEVSKIDKAALLGVAVPEALGGVSNPDFLMTNVLGSTMEQNRQAPQNGAVAYPILPTYEFLLELKEKDVAYIDAINRELICNGYKALFRNGIPYASFISEKHIKNDIYYLNTDPNGFLEYPELERPLTPDDFYDLYPTAYPGLCYLNLDMASSANYHNTAILFQWIIQNFDLLEPNEAFDSYLSDEKNSSIIRQLLLYQPNATSYINFNKQLNKLNQMVLSEDNIRYLFGAQEYLQDKTYVPSGMLNALEALCLEYECYYTIDRLKLLIGRDVLIACDKNLYYPVESSLTKPDQVGIEYD